MRRYLYFSMSPESLVASQLPPEEFGRYLAVGTKKSANDQAMFFELKEGFESTEFDFRLVSQRCVPHPDGRPKHSLYLAIYRVLERLPLEALGSLWLVTVRGQVLELKASVEPPQLSDNFYLYQELCPVHPLIASELNPPEFVHFITDPGKPLFVPRICFTDIDLGDLASDPRQGTPRELYYPDRFWHLRECLLELQAHEHKRTKTVDRLHPQQFPYHCIKTGVYVGDQHEMLFYPFPSRADLEGQYYYWWRRSAHH